jgi:hypothetical protein
MHGAEIDGVVASSQQLRSVTNLNTHVSSCCRASPSRPYRAQIASTKQAQSNHQ